ncbi:hypothetical protein F4604DRAFT_1679199 [Suillus subluteus]|nr:hypothetical protein F4604DRAFT_1679199 [Suillus subluteus]
MIILNGVLQNNVLDQVVEIAKASHDVDASSDDNEDEDENDDPDFPTVRTFADKVDIIKQWQHEMSFEMQECGACAVCAHNVCNIADAFARASAYDLMLVSRARASQIIHFYAYKPSGHWIAEESSQRYNQGNVAIRPQDSAELRNMLPPSQDELRDAMCVIFAGHQEKPSRDTVKQMHPILVTKSIVKMLIEFLVMNNPWYQQRGVSYDQNNMDALFEELDGDVDMSIPRALQICHLPRDDEVDQFSPLESRDVNILEHLNLSQITMEVVGFTKGDHSAMSREKMKLLTLAHVLDHNKFILSKAGSHFVSDNNPGLMSFCFHT